MNETTATAKATVSEIIKKAEDLQPSSLPLIRISTEGKILYANSSAWPVLKDWRSEEENKLPSWIMKLHPMILQMNADLDITVFSSSYEVQLSVVGYPDGGYISLSAFSVAPNSALASGMEPGSSDNTTSVII